MDPTSSFNVVIDEIRPSRLLLSDGLAMFTDASTHSSKSYILQHGFAKLDFHKSSGHIRLTNLMMPGDTGMIFRVLPQTVEFAPFTPIPSSERLTIETQVCLDSLRSYFQTKEESLIASDSNNEYSSSKPVFVPVGEPLSSTPLSFALPESLRPKETWPVARITNHVPGKPSTAFEIKSMTFQHLSLTRLRLYPSFASLSAKLIANNPKFPAVPSNWRRDQRALQKELDTWLTDLLRIDPENKIILDFLASASDAFTPQEIGSSSSNYLGFSFALGSMMESKPYISAFETQKVVPKPITWLLGVSGAGKSSFLNDVLGFPVCDPVGRAPEAPNVLATFYEVLPPSEFVPLAKFQSYWTHPNAFHLANYPLGAEAISVEQSKLQEPIVDGITTSWKLGGAFFILDHAATLDRYHIYTHTTFKTTQCRTCIINEAALDPIRLEFEIAKRNIFVEINHFDLALKSPSIASNLLRSSIVAESTLSKSDKSQAALTPGHFKFHPKFIPQLLELADLRLKCHRTLYFGTFDKLHSASEDILLLELAEVLSSNQDTFGFTNTLNTWVEKAITKTKGPNNDTIESIDLIKLLGLMKNWTNLLPSPRRPCHVLFLTTKDAPSEAIQSIAKSFTIHDILATEGTIIKTLDSLDSTLSHTSLGDPVATSSAISHSSVTMLPSTTRSFVYDYLLATPARNALFTSLLGGYRM